MIRVTLDTNILPVTDFLDAALEKGFEFAVISVTRDEVAGTSYEVVLERLPSTPATIPFGANGYGSGTFGGGVSTECCERVLTILANGSFPPITQRGALTPGQDRQLRDAHILCTHIRDARDIFVTNDFRGFINHGRAERLSAEFGIRIMSRDDFVSLVNAQDTPLDKRA